ncbi:NAD(P)H-dependent oxidoreductase KNAG_0C04760 [Huiozyma naganishii CBS 8797]|uniref:Flavodoxin-like fold domain-containing protein n=1 Tax=Huiozyma naganishii (strain ATCC MYA-139 / BCRC 22969 / CBS 8797 / KCTC 17520 / NBRC 10181 / NCYC 3082 / Yp74L-3) TaxID=1071383 RepID=J7RX13_HUIN7|nr:hypothetical protein KNAG_0C04760 [Kazachstania naganishii CBS 8797]CCK69577.1 hypothetical protein KNAG_0C04760 [Kazachstania naganishii CBS 8797]
MKVFIVYAHPESKSFNGSFLNATVKHLESRGNEVRVSDLYQENFKAIVDASDFLNHNPEERLQVVTASFLANKEDKLTADVKKAQENLKWADLVVLQFPLWWFSMPAIMKGWVERVFSCGFGYGVGEHSDKRWGDRYGEGMLAGKRAILAITVGGWVSHYSARGINGPIEDLLFPITHGVLNYIGMTAMPSHITYRTDGANEDKFGETTHEWFQKLDTIETANPIPYRKQNFGDYEIPSLELKAGLEKPGQLGFALARQE